MLKKIKRWRFRQRIGTYKSSRIKKIYYPELTTKQVSLTAGWAQMKKELMIRWIGQEKNSRTDAHTEGNMENTDKTIKETYWT